MAWIQKIMSRSLLKTIAHNAVKGRGMCLKELDKPVKFSSSKAAAWKAEFSRSGDSSDTESAWFQPYVVTGSVAAFLLYFCVLREENSIDEAMMVPLYHTIDGLEEVQLRRSLQYRLDNGLPTEDITKRLEEIKRENQMKNEE